MFFHYSGNAWNLDLHICSRNLLEKKVDQEIAFSGHYNTAGCLANLKSSEIFFGNRSFSIISPGALCISNTSLPSVEFLIDIASLWLHVQNPCAKLDSERISGLAV